MKHPLADRPSDLAGNPDGSVSRRALIAGTAVGFLFPARPSPAEGAPEKTVTEALRARRSTRAFSDRPVAPALLAELMWAACGVNRESSGLRTAPSWRGAADVQVHVAGSDGVQQYHPERNELSPRLRTDIRPILSTQPFVATAPVCLILLSVLRKLAAADLDDQKRLYAQIDAAVIAQNVYLFAAARGLGTCLVGGLDRPAIIEAMKLRDYEFPAFVQPVGWPA